MYSKEESKQLMHEFWEKFDHYTKFYGKKMLEPIKWMFYKTGIKGLELKFEIDKKKVMVVLEVNAKNENRRFDIYVFLNEYRSIIEYGVAFFPN